MGIGQHSPYHMAPGIREESPPGCRYIPDDIPPDMMKFEAVLFDWMLTLAHYPSEEEHVVSALRQLGRDADSVSIGGTVADLFEARNHSDAKAASLV